jgi:outer membrane protein OmpA-like peptidoglycan-associated protein
MLTMTITCNSFGQQERVLRGPEANEANLIHALQPKELTRSFVVRPTAGQPAANRPPSASMLITFETNAADLTMESKKVLDSLGRAMQSDKLSAYKFEIEGHADPRGEAQFNLELSQRRAEAVVSYLESTHQIDRARLRPVGKGQTELFDRVRVEAPENRRVTVKTIVN